MFQSTLKEQITLQDAPVDESRLTLTVDRQTMEQVLQRLRRKHLVQEDIRIVEKDSIVTCRLESDVPKYQKSSIQLTVGLGLFNPTLEAQMIGLELEQSRQMQLEDGAAVTVTVLSIVRRVFPELTDALVEGENIPGVRTVEEYRQMLLENAENEVRAKQARQLAFEAMEALCGLCELVEDREEVEALVASDLALLQVSAASRGLDSSTMDGDALFEFCGVRSQDELYPKRREQVVQYLKGALMALPYARKDGVSFSWESYEQYVRANSKKYLMDYDQYIKAETYQSYLVKQYFMHLFQKLTSHYSQLLH